MLVPQRLIAGKKYTESHDQKIYIFIYNFILFFVLYYFVYITFLYSYIYIK